MPRSIAAGEIARLSYDAHAVDRPARAGRNRCACAPIARIPTAACSARSTRPISRSATSPGLSQPAGRRAPAAAASRSPTGRCSTRSPSTAPGSRAICRPAGTRSFIATENYSHLAARTARQRYVFDDVPLIYGDNRFEIILYGPQGQQRSRLETINVGQSQVPAGKTWYWAGISQPGRNLLSNFVGRDDGGGPPATREPAISTGPTSRRRSRSNMASTSAPRSALLATMLLADDERLTFVEGSVRRSIGPALVEAAVARDSNGGMAARAQAVAQLRLGQRQRRSAAGQRFRHQRRARDALSRQRGCRSMRRSRSAASASRRMATCAWSIAARDDRTLNARGRLSTNFNGFNLTSLVNWQRRLGSDRAASGRSAGRRPDRHRPRRRRPPARRSDAGTSSPHSRFRTRRASAPIGRRRTAPIGKARSPMTPTPSAAARASRTSAGSTALAAAASIEAGTDGSFAAGINLNFSLDSAAGGFKLTSQRLASTGIGRGAGLSRPQRQWRARRRRAVGRRRAHHHRPARLGRGRPTSRGVVRVGGLQPFQPIAVGIDTSSLADPSLAPRKALQVVVPRPGVAAKLEIGLVGVGRYRRRAGQERRPRLRRPRCRAARRRRQGRRHRAQRL